MKTTTTTPLASSNKSKRIGRKKVYQDKQTFEPIHSGDREALTRLASNFTGGESLNRRSTGAGDELSRRDTLYNVNVGDAVLDPRSPEFDVYKWSRMYVPSCPCATSTADGVQVDETHRRE